jgi:hypothetical protein
MPNDIRAISTCSLGVIIGNAEINDEYINGGAGLVKTTGSVTINGLITPAVGTPVTFSYTKSGTTRQVPRALRVLSSQADPATRRTAVELGCKLTYLNDLRERINWRAADDPTNTLTTDDAKIITIPIFAQGIAQKCLTELGLTAASFTLTNAFSIAKFDLSPGYVQILSDLLVSESLVGYLNTSEVLQVVSLQQDGGTGPVFDIEQLKSSRKIGSGRLPAETVIARYSSLKLRQPQQTQPLGWQEQSNSVTYRIQIPYTLSETGAGQIASYNILESTKIETEYKDIKIKDDNTLRLPARRITTFTSGAAAHAGNVFSEYLSNSIGVGNSQVSKITTEVYEYDNEGNEKRYDRSVIGSLVFALGSISVPIVFDSGYVGLDFNKSLALEREVRETTTIDNTQQVTTQTYVPWFLTIAGQQAISAGREGLDSPAAVVAYLDGIIAAGLRLNDYRIETIETPRPRGVPSLADQNKAAAAKNGDPNNGWQTAAEAKILLAMGSATAQRRIEFTPPYVPDDRFSKTVGGYISIPSDADSKALTYARVQNRLDHANRNGMNIQVLPELLPDNPFSPIILRSGGVSALYRTNGTAWTISQDGVVVSTDALFWGAVGGSGPRWFPVAPGITTLPTAPPVVGGQMTVGQVVPVANETLELVSRTRISISVQAFDYLPSETITLPPFMVRPRLAISEVVPDSVTLRVRSLLSAAEVIPESVNLPVRSLLSVTEIIPESILLKIRTRIIAAVSNPIADLSPLFLYDFNELSTVTTSGSEITGISDQGSLGWNLTKIGTGPTLANWGNGNNCADWGSQGHGNALRYVYSGSSRNIAQIFIVLDANFGSTFPNYNGLISSTTDDSLDFAVTGILGNSSFAGEPNWFNFASLNGNSTNQINSILPGINSRCVLMMKNTDNSTSLLDDGIQIGNDRSNLSRGWGGLIGLVVGFSSVLNSTDEANLIDYLMTRWNV